MRLLERALKIDPNDPKALTLAGAAAFEAKDYKRAIAYWERLLGQVPADSELGQALRAGSPGAPARGSETAPAAAVRPRRWRRRRSAAKCAWPPRSRVAPASGYGVRGCARGRRAAHAPGGAAQTGQGSAAHFALDDAWPWRRR